MAINKTAKQLTAYAKQRKPGSQAGRNKPILPPMALPGAPQPMGAGLPPVGAGLGNLSSWASPTANKKIKSKAKKTVKGMLK